MEKIPASKLRAEAKHDATQRQLPALAAAALIIAVCFRAFAQTAVPSAARDELRAAKLMETALFARQAGAAEWRKLDGLYRDLNAKYPRDPAILAAHGEFLWGIGEHSRAAQAWLAAERIEPGNAVVLDHLGGSFLAAGEARKAAGYYAQAVARAPAVAAYHYNYANVAFLFRHELLDPEHADADALLKKALAHFAEASRLKPLDPEYARSYAETFYSVPVPDWRAALQAWEHFYEISPQKDFALLNLARVHMKLGQKTEARARLSQIQSSEFNGLKSRLGERIEAE